MKERAAGGAQSLRLKDLQLVTELLAEAVEREARARERIANRYGIQKSVITDAVGRIERFFGVEMFCGPQRKTPTAAGRQVARWGPRLLSEIEYFAEMLRDARD